VFFSALFLLQFIWIRFGGICHDLSGVTSMLGYYRLLGDEKVGNSEQVIEKWGMYKDRCPTTTVVASKAL